jgi:hypothetical protein
VNHKFSITIVVADHEGPMNTRQNVCIESCVLHTDPTSVLLRHLAFGF